MKVVYEASNSLEGHMIANLLEQANIFAQVGGDYLQGGVGELQAFGLVKVRVNSDDFEQAREIVRQWEAGQAKVGTDSVTPRLTYLHLLVSFLLGILVGAFLAG